MNKIFAERLKSARMMNGFSLQDLSDKLETKITRQALHKYEKGEVIPDSEMMGFLCDALNVRPDFFSRETKIELGQINFRKLVRCPEKEQKSVIERTKDILSRYLELEEIIGIKEGFEHPLPLIKVISSVEDVELAAEKIREKWKIGDEPISNVVELLEDNHIKVIELDANDSFDGLQSWINGNIPVIVINNSKFKSRDRKRFTIIHELGHLLLPLDQVEEKMAEKFCHIFAGAILIPRKALIRELGVKRNKLSIQELGILKQQFGISIQAIVMRAMNLRIISDYYTKYFFKYISEMGWKTEEPYKLEGEENSKRFDQLIFRGLSEEVISMNKAASLMNMKLAEFRSKKLVVG